MQKVKVLGKKSKIRKKEITTIKKYKMIQKWLTQGNQGLSSYTNGRDSYITKDSIIPSQLLIFMVGQVVIFLR